MLKKFPDKIILDNEPVYVCDEREKHNDSSMIYVRCCHMNLSPYEDRELAKFLTQFFDVYKSEPKNV